MFAMPDFIEVRNLKIKAGRHAPSLTLLTSRGPGLFFTQPQIHQNPTRSWRAWVARHHKH
jgi:hypothetical protein